MENLENTTCSQGTCECEYTDVRPAADVYDEDNGVAIIFEVPGCNAGISFHLCRRRDFA